MTDLMKEMDNFYSTHATSGPYKNVMSVDPSPWRLLDACFMLANPLSVTPVHAITSDGMKYFISLDYLDKYPSRGLDELTEPLVSLLGEMLAGQSEIAQPIAEKYEELYGKSWRRTRGIRPQSNI